MELKQNSFPGCCGIQILWDFGNTEVSLGENRRATVSAINKAIDDALLEPLVLNPNNYPANYLPPLPPVKAITLIALNETQHKKLHKLLLKKGFKLIVKGWNKNHNGMNYLYSINLKKGKEKLDLE